MRPTFGSTVPATTHHRGPQSHAQCHVLRRSTAPAGASKGAKILAALRLCAQGDSKKSRPKGPLADLAIAGAPADPDGCSAPVSLNPPPAGRRFSAAASDVAPPDDPECRRHGHHGEEWCPPAPPALPAAVRGPGRPSGGTHQHWDTGRSPAAAGQAVRGEPAAAQVWPAPVQHTAV